MRTMRMLWLAGMLALPLVESAETFQMTQAGAGAGTGVDVANAISVSFFNTAGNWGAGAGKISPGDFVILNSTVTSTLVVQTGGTAGNPITVQFASGGKMSAGHWNQGGANGNAAIFVNGYDYIIVDGGANGIIEATSNGTGLTTALQDRAVWFESGSDHCEVKNLTINGLFVRTSGSASTTEDQTAGVRFVDSSGNNLVHDNTITDACYGIWFTHSGNISGDQIYNNVISKRDAGIIYGSSSTGVATGVQMVNNAIGDAIQWDDPGDYFHHDAIHTYSCGAGCSGHVDGILLNKNYFFGNPGIHSTAFIYFEDWWTNPIIINNVTTNTSGNRPSNGHIAMKGRGQVGNGAIANNLLTAVGSGGNLLNVDTCTGNYFVNNVCEGDAGINSCGMYLTAAGDSSNTVNNNCYHNINQWSWNNLIRSSFSQWKSDTGVDANSFTTAPNLASNGAPNAGSPLIDTGLSMASYFTTDRAGVTRPQGSAWDVGAYEYVSGGGGGNVYTVRPGRVSRRGRF